MYVKGVRDMKLKKLFYTLLYSVTPAGRVNSTRKFLKVLENETVITNYFETQCLALKNCCVNDERWERAFKAPKKLFYTFDA